MARSADLCLVWSGKRKKERRICVFAASSCSSVKVWELFPPMETPSGVLELGQVLHVIDTHIWKSNVENFFPSSYGYALRWLALGREWLVKALKWKTNLSTFSLICTEVES